ncbi:hypothetical protein J2847_006785 [Azospirillum agricola]|uniref:hypothetical protein n=1 Tax=Azospirillum agricola TaxID=1720247 RepID=UPI001AE41938|nr:hypothetical protein [Azospirillum agricola]MBP2233447.1 hypothetical protein [Azospirillum agricola]
MAAAAQQVNVRLRPDHADLVRRVAARLKAEDGFAGALDRLLSRPDPAPAPTTPDDDRVGALEAAVGELRQRVAALEEGEAPKPAKTPAKAPAKPKVAPAPAPVLGTGTMSQADYARWHDVSRTSVNKWKEAGHLTMAGDKVDVAASDRCLSGLGMGRFREKKS